ncbi:MAG: AMP-binding protein [Alphaproteobacteria bacterium]|nr:AMP-binding protein [Alphaproteobacteria bacterium]
MQTMYDLVRIQADRTPDALALVDDRSERSLSYRALIDEIDAIAAGFAARGVAAGTKVATCLPNLFEHCLAVLALQRLAAVPALINARLKPDEVARLIEAGGLAGAVVLPDPALVEAVAGALPDNAPLFAVGSAVDAAADFTTCRGSATDLPPVPRPDPEDTCIIFYTSGTTGLPKGVVLAHRTSEHRIVWLSTQAGLRYGPHNKALGFMPLAHAIGFYGMFLVTLAFGGTYYVMSAFDPAAAVDLVEKHGITYMFAAPTLYYAMVNAPNYAPARMASVELVLYGGAIIDPRLVDHMDGQWANAVVRHIYGTTETMCSGHNPDPVGDSAALRPGYYTALRYIAMGGGPDDLIGPGEEGELIVEATGDTIFSEYLNRPDATAEKLRGGWYYTGDVISVDERGYFTLRGRVDDMIRTGGESVHPEEVEAVLRDHADVADCSVIGLEDPKWGQAIVGCVVSKGTGDAAALDAHCKASALAGFKRPRAYIFVDEIPRNPGNGNVLRRILREQAGAMRERGEGFVTLGG